MDRSDENVSPLYVIRFRWSLRFSSARVCARIKVRRRAIFRLFLNALFIQRVLHVESIAVIYIFFH